MDDISRDSFRLKRNNFKVHIAKETRPKKMDVMKSVKPKRPIRVKKRKCKSIDGPKSREKGFSEKDNAWEIFISLFLALMPSKPKPNYENPNHASSSNFSSIAT